jgi:hypothetical protein
MGEHTPTPWKIGDRKPYIEVWGPMRMNSSPILASMEHEPRDANAAFIVKAVNNHEALIKALKNVQVLISEAAMTGFNWKDGDWAERLFASQQETSAILRAVVSGPQLEFCDVSSDAETDWERTVAEARKLLIDVGGKQ